MNSTLYHFLEPIQHIIVHVIVPYATRLKSNFQNNNNYDNNVHPNADSYRDLSPKQIYRQHENEKKRKYATRVLEIEQGTFTPLVFSTAGGMGEECHRFHRRLAELLASKK